MPPAINLKLRTLWRLNGPSAGTGGAAVIDIWQFASDWALALFALSVLGLLTQWIWEVALS